jgi:hypothetical protein
VIYFALIPVAVAAVVFVTVYLVRANAKLFSAEEPVLTRTPDLDRIEATQRELDRHRPSMQPVEPSSHLSAEPEPCSACTCKSNERKDTGYKPSSTPPDPFAAYGGTTGFIVNYLM